MRRDLHSSLRLPFRKVCRVIWFRCGKGVYGSVVLYPFKGRYSQLQSPIFFFFFSSSYTPRPVLSADRSALLPCMPSDTVMATTTSKKAKHAVTVDCIDDPDGNQAENASPAAYIQIVHADLLPDLLNLARVSHTHPLDRDHIQHSPTLRQTYPRKLPFSIASTLHGRRFLSLPPYRNRREDLYAGRLGRASETTQLQGQSSLEYRSIDSTAPFLLDSPEHDRRIEVQGPCLERQNFARAERPRTGPLLDMS